MTSREVFAAGRYKFPKLTVKRHRQKGYHLHTCWKCGRQWFAKNGKTWLPSKRQYRYICHSCKEKMGLE